MIVDFMFLADFFITCFSAYYDEHEGVLVTNNKKIIVRYLRSWFLIDLVTSMPISFIENSIIQFGNVRLSS